MRNLGSGFGISEKLIKIGAKEVERGRYVTFRMVEVAIPRDLFAVILRKIDRLRVCPGAGWRENFAEKHNDLKTHDRERRLNTSPRNPSFIRVDDHPVADGAVGGIVEIQLGIALAGAGPPSTRPPVQARARAFHEPMDGVRKFVEQRNPHFVDPIVHLGVSISRFDAIDPKRLLTVSEIIGSESNSGVIIAERDV